MNIEHKLTGHIIISERINDINYKYWYEGYKEKECINKFKEYINNIKK